MSKRNQDSGNSSRKKPRLDEFGDFWEDDFDGDVIDDCFARATQVCQQENDVTLMSSYSIFKEPKNIFTSTQNSMCVLNHGDNLQDKIKELQQKYAEKEGEVAILRTNLQSLRVSCQVDQEKKQAEWKEKLIGVEKENKRIKSELEFKNLEVANLKQQIAELSRIVNTEQTATQKSRVVDCKTPFSTSPKKFVKEILDVNPRISINAEKLYPLKHFDPSPMFKTSLTDGFYLQTQVVKDNQKCFNLSKIYPEVSFLLNCTQDDLDSDDSVVHVKKIIEFSNQLLTDFYRCLKQIEVDIQLQDVQELDELYLQNNSCIRLNDLGLKSSEVLRFLAEILPFNSYLKKYLSVNNSAMDTDTTNGFFLLLKIVSIVGKARKEETYSTFLSALIRLLCRGLCSQGVFCSSNFLIEFSKEILYLKPDFDVIVQTTFFLNILTRNFNLISVICSKSNQNQENSDKEFCRFHTFVVLLEEKFPQIQNENVLSKVSSNILNCIYNVFRLNNSWIYQQESKTCDCLCKLYKLGIGMIHKKLKTCKTLDTNKVKIMCKNSVKILSLLTFNSYDLTQKYVRDFAQFKEIMYILRLLDDGLEYDNNLNNLEKLIAAEDFPEIPPEKFSEIDF